MLSSASNPGRHCHFGPQYDDCEIIIDRSSHMRTMCHTCRSVFDCQRGSGPKSYAFSICASPELFGSLPLLRPCLGWLPEIPLALNLGPGKLSFCQTILFIYLIFNGFPNRITPIERVSTVYQEQYKCPRNRVKNDALQICTSFCFEADENTKFVCTNQFQVKGMKIGTGQKFVFFQYCNFTRFSV